MTMPKNLVLVRHGEAEGNVAGDFSKKGDHSLFDENFLSRHSSEWRLTDRGIEQAKFAGYWIRTEVSPLFDRYYASEYLRAMETAGHLELPNAKWFAEFYLRERDWGRLDVMSEEKRRQQFSEEILRRKIDGFFWRPPGGETMADLCLRVDRVLSTLHRECENKDVIIVCHGEVMWALRMRIERMSQVKYRALDASKDPFNKIHNCQIIHYTRKNPETGLWSQYCNWMRSVCPWNLKLSSNAWQVIERPVYLNEDLLALAEQTPRLINRSKPE